MAIEIMRNGALIAYLDQDFKNHRGLDLYVFNTGVFGSSSLIDELRKALNVKAKEVVGTKSNDDKSSLEARLVYTRHVKCEEGRKLLTGLMTEASKKIFTTAEYLASL